MATASPLTLTFPTGNTCSLTFDLVVFDFRNHGQNVPIVPPHHNYEQLTRDLERIIQAVKVQFGRPVPFNVGTDCDEACH